MLASTYDDALARVFAHEGGYTNHPADPGGPTNFGITLRDARAYWRAHATAADVRAMPVTVAKDIYRARYAAPLRFHELPPGVDYAVLDYGINSGVGRSARVLQRLAGVTVDGEIGAQTLAAARARDPRVLVAAICDERLAFLKTLKTWPAFGRGWARRVAEVRAAALVMAGRAQGVAPIILPPPPHPSPLTRGSRILSGASVADYARSPRKRGRGRIREVRDSGVETREGGSRSEPGGEPPWLARMNAILGLYEFAGSADNPAIVAMARACGGKIARTYKHDATPWCALAVNYCLVASGLPGNDSLWALDFARYGRRLAGPAIGAIACKKRQGGGHVFLVVGRTATGKLVGRGGNQADMVCDQEFDPSEIVAWRWPDAPASPSAVRDAGATQNAPAPANIGLAALPIVTPATRERRTVALPPPLQAPAPGKGTVPPAKAAKDALGKGAPAAGIGLGAVMWQWVIAHPWESAGIAAAVTLAIALALDFINRRHRQQQEAPTPGLVPVGAQREKPMKAILVTTILVCLCILTLRHRDRIAAWWPGLKTNAWNVAVAATGIAGAVLDELRLFNWHALLTPENAALAGLSIAVVGILLRQVTETRG